MALVARNTDLTKISPGAAGAMKAPNLAGYKAGVAIDAAGLACRIHSDGTILLSDGTSATAIAQCDGFSACPAAIGEAVTLLGAPTVFGEYGSGMTPGANLYLSTTPGRLDTSATTGNIATLPVARVMPDGKAIRILRFN